MSDDASTLEKLNGANTWQCTHWYPSADDAAEERCTHDVVAHRRGNKWVLESVPNDDKSHMVVNLTLDGSLATGSWTEQTLGDGTYEGLTYSGAMQLLVSPDGKHMDGKWVGIGREPQADGGFQPKIYTGRWLIEQAA